MKLETAKAILNRAGTKEEIQVNGETFIKSCPAGRWEYVVLVTIPAGAGRANETRHILGKSGSKEAADKWVPFPMSIDYLDIPQEDYQARLKEALKRGGGAWRRKFNMKAYVVPIAYTRQVLKIER